MARSRADYADLANIEAEASVLGAIYCRPEIIYEVADELKPEAFYREAHRLLYTVMLKLAQDHKSVDIVSTTEELRDEGLLNRVGGIQFVTHVANSEPTSAYWKQHAEIVKAYARRRALCDVADAIKGAACDLGEDVDMADIQSRVASVAMNDGKRDAQRTMLEELMDYTAWEEKQAANGGSGILSGFTQLDIVTHGWQPGELIILAARPSVGKSAFALAMALHMTLDARKQVAYFSLEMSRQQLISRALANMTGISANIVGHPAERQQSDWDAITAQKDRLAKATLHLYTENIDTPLKIYSKARQAQGKFGLDLIIIDHMHLMTSGRKGDGTNRTQEMSYISRQLKLMAMELDVPVISLAQLNRGTEGRDDKRPRLSDLRDSGSIEQDADIVMLMYRENYYQRQQTDEDIVEVNVAKHRNGPLANIAMKFHKETSSFEKIPYDAQYVPASSVPV